MDKTNRNVFEKKTTIRKAVSNRRRRRNPIPNPLKSDQNIKICCSSDGSNSSASNASFDRNLLSNWSFPPKVHQFYASKGIKSLFDWQVECLNLDNVLEGKNLVYSAPTSAGKSIVSDILLYKNLLERKKKALIILPFVSVTQERMLSLKYVLKSIGVRVDAFAGGVNPRGGLSRVDVAVCTIEKANNMINRLIEEKRLNEIGLIVVDELHMIGDSSRGYLLELLLTKILYLCPKIEHNIQIVGLSATIPNLNVIAKWLSAELYITQFRPVPLFERVNFGDIIYDSPQMTEFRHLDISQLGINSDDSHTIFLAIETLTRGFGSLIFCATKAMCENCCRNIATNIYEFGRGKKPQNDLTKDIMNKLLPALNFVRIKQVLEQLNRCPAGLDPILEATVKFGVAFHHAGLSLDERAIIEQAFRDGIIKILCATSTLSAGVNLPARLVIIKSPLDFRGSVMDVLTYRQMIGRAGRQGVDTMGESILICPEKDKPKAQELLKSDLKPIGSCLVKIQSNYSNGQLNTSINSLFGLKRAILEIIANGTATSYDDVSKYIEYTFMASISSDVVTKSFIDEIITYLIDFKLIHSMTETESQEKKISPTQFGKAVLASGISPDEGLFIMDELNRAKQSICLCNDLHLLYEVTPTYLSEQMESIDWQHFLDIWNKLDADMHKVGKLIGIREHFIINQITGVCVFDDEGRRLLSIHRRFYAGLALHDLIQEVPLYKVAKKFKISKGVLQSLQQSSSSFAGMITIFCNKLGWHNLEILIEQFQSRLYFGVQRELIDLMRITSLNASVARLLYNHSYDTVVSLAKAKKTADIELILMNSGPFDKNKKMDSTVMWVPGMCRAMNAREMANSIILEARELINKDLGVNISDWVSQTSSTDSNEVPIDLEQLSQEILEIPLNSNDFTNILNRNSVEKEKDENVGECVEPVEDMSFIEQSANSCDKSSFINRSKPYITSPMITSPIISLNTTETYDLPENDTSIQNVVSSTPIIHSNRLSKSRLQKEKKLENRSTDKQKTKDTSMSFSFGDSLNEISWDRLDLEIQKFSQNDNDLNEKNLPELSVRSKHLTHSKSPDLLRDYDSVSSKSEHSSKRSSSPSPTGKNCERLAKKTLTTTSSVSLFNSDNSNFLSDDSLGTFKRENTPSLESLDCLDSPLLIKTRFKKLKIGDKFVISRVESNDLSIENFMNKWMLKRTFSINFIVEEKTSNVVQLIGSKIKNLKKTTKENTGLDMHHNNNIITCLIVCFEGEDTVYYVSSDEALNKIKEQLKYKLQKDSKVISFDIKMSYKILRQCFEIDIKTLNAIDWFDIRIAHWMLDPESVRPHRISQLTKNHIQQYFYLSMSKNNIIEDECNSTGLSFPLINTLMDKLDDKNLFEAYKCVEIPSRYTLANMELNGIGIDYDYMNEKLNLLKDIKRQLEAKAYEMANTKFKLSSPSETAKVLYEHLNLLSNYYNVQKKTNKTRGKPQSDRKLPKHLSVSKPALKRLESLCNNPLPSIILDWRRVDYAIKKSINPVLNHVHYDNESKMYSINTMCDDWSSTGRISLHDPNLIGISKDFCIRDISIGEGESSVTDNVSISLRRIFIAREGYKLVSADYSQLELRILAHLSRDKQLCSVLNEGGDVFKNIAALWKSKSIDEITNDERQQAKQICYGMVYGIGEKSLSEDLAVSEEEAKEFMESFLSKYEGVKQFISNTIDECIEREFVETMNGRRRYLPHIKSSNSMIRLKAERQAVNSTIQGSAADLVKTAMIAVDKALINSDIDAHIVLEMHDELMYEVNNCHTIQFIDLLRKSMESCFKNFTVKLPVKSKMGQNWGQLNEIIDSNEF